MRGILSRKGGNDQKPIQLPNTVSWKNLFSGNTKKMSFAECLPRVLRVKSYKSREKMYIYVQDILMVSLRR